MTPLAASHPAHRLPPRAWLTVVLLFFVVCSNYLARVMVPTMHGSLVRAIPMTDAKFGLLSSAFLWVYGLASPFAGFLADRFSRTRVILLSMFSWSLITWLTAYVTTFPELLTMRVLMALSEVCYMPAALALVTDYHRGPTRARATGLHSIGMSTGAMLGGLGGWLAERHTWGYAFVVIGVASLAYCLVLVFVLRDAPRHGKAEDPGIFTEPSARFGTAVSSVFSHASFTLLILGVALLGGGGWIITAWLPTFLAENFKLGQGFAGMSATGFTSGAGVVGLLVAGILSDRWSRTNLRARVYVSVIGLCVATPALLMTANTGIFALAILGLVLCGLMRSFYDVNTMPLLCLVVDSRYRATGYGLVNLASTFTGGVLVYFSGMLRDHHVPLKEVIIFVAAAQALCICLLLMIKPLPLARRDRPVAGAPLEDAEWH